ncbi:MAG: hypothetical protein HKN57_08660 [Xanthomonadales bacterium]|nr:hypothetical protein [Gammaproteobacteria bacterium]MBT8054910.1 hypothetical protein [Gammaproteobacteria bacterium]NND57312.1 hypothetical protein [Xanthomonadales bacterium]NNK51046.1 hypothetical protein [Xanthomonadales bacterium]
MDTAIIKVARFSDSDNAPLVQLLSRHGLAVRVQPAVTPIPGSFWGDEEAGLIGDSLLVSPDTPIHSILHEACHYICMDDNRRRGLDTDAGGDYEEENAVCYLQILLSDEIPGFGREQMMRDMDSWGYSFRLGSAAAWFEQDAEDAQAWLLDMGLITASGKPAFRLRSER